MAAYICADLGGSRIKVGLFQQGNLTVKRIFDVADTNQTKVWLEQLEGTISELLTDSYTAELSGLALAYAGPIRCKARQLLPSNGKYLNVTELDLAAWAEQWTQNLIVDNDARLACVGEWRYGAGKGCDNLVCVTLGTGIGTSVVIGGRVLRGYHDLAGCLGGHFTIDQGIKYGKQRCSCGNLGCVEALASTDRFAELQSRFVAAENHVQTFQEAFNAAQSGQPGFVDMQQFIISVWGSAIVNYIHAYDPQMIVLSGGIISDNGPYLLAALQAYVDEYAWQHYEKVRLCQGYADEAALYGGFYLLEHGEENVTL